MCCPVAAHSVRALHSHIPSVVQERLRAGGPLLLGLWALLRPVAIVAPAADRGRRRRHAGGLHEAHAHQRGTAAPGKLLCTAALYCSCQTTASIPHLQHTLCRSPLPFSPCPSPSRPHSLQDNTRWARLVCELLREVWQRAERSAWHAHLEVAAKLQALVSLDSNGRQVLPSDAKTELSRCYCLALAAAPLLDATPRLGERSSLTSRDFVRLLVASVRGGTEVQQGIAVLALGCMHPACHALVLSEAAGLADDYLDRQMQRVRGARRGGVRGEDPAARACVC